MIKGVIFDFNRTLYNPDTGKLEEGALNLLEQFSQRYKLCLISKKSKEEREQQIVDLGIFKYFLDIQVIIGNKQPEHFQRCLDKMQLSSIEVAVIGDRIKEEIRLGNKFGMTTIWYKHGKFASEYPQTSQETPHFIINDLRSIIEYL